MPRAAAAAGHPSTFESVIFKKRGERSCAAFHFTENNIAMVPYFGSRLTRAATLTQENTLTFDWDVVSYPVHSDRPGVGPMFDAQVYYVSKTSEHPEEAFRVIHYMTSSEETQTSVAKSAKARPSINMDQGTLNSIFGADFPVLKEKNIAGVFKTTPSPRNIATEYDSIAGAAIRRAFSDYVQGTDDVNTVLRMAEEQANLEIEELKKSKSNGS